MCTLTPHEWCETGLRLFGPDQSAWRFRCSCCGFEASIGDYIAARVQARGIGRHCLSCGRKASDQDVVLVDDDMHRDAVLPWAPQAPAA